MTKTIIAAAIVILVSTGAWAYFGQRTSVEFYKGHTHGPDGHAINAPSHSGGLDRKGCHNGSVPYHCH